MDVLSLLRAQMRWGTFAPAHCQTSSPYALVQQGARQGNGLCLPWHWSRRRGRTVALRMAAATLWLAHRAAISRRANNLDSFSMAYFVKESPEAVARPGAKQVVQTLPWAGHLRAVHSTCWPLAACARLQRLRHKPAPETLSESRSALCSGGGCPCRMLVLAFSLAGVC